MPGTSHMNTLVPPTCPAQGGAVRPVGRCVSTYWGVVVFTTVTIPSFFCFCKCNKTAKSEKKKTKPQKAKKNARAGRLFVFALRVSVSMFMFLVGAAAALLRAPFAV